MSQEINAFGRQGYPHMTGDREYDELMSKVIKNEGEQQGQQRFLDTIPRDTHEEPPKECKLDKLEEVLPEGQWMATFNAGWTGGLSRTLKKQGRTPQDGANKLRQCVCEKLELDYQGRSKILDDLLHDRPPQHQVEGLAERMSKEDNNPCRENRFKLAHGFDFGAVDAEWDVFDLRFFQIKLVEDEGPSVYAFAVYNPDMKTDTWLKREHFKAQFEMGHAKVQITPVEVDIADANAQLGDHQDLRELLTDYHRQIMEHIDWTFAEDMTFTSFLILRLVVNEAEPPPKGWPLDINGMRSEDASDLAKDIQPQLPEEAVTLNILRMEFASRYHTWTAFQKHTPIHPTPSSDLLQVILGGDEMQSQTKVRSQPSRAELAASGRAMLHVLLAAASFQKCHLQDAGRLEEHLKGQLAKKRVAQLLIDSKVLALTSDKVTFGDDKSEQELEDLLEEITMALVGAYAKAGGHFYSAAQLWSWMDKDVPFEEWFRPISYIFFGPSRYFLGRTTTYDKISEEDHDGEPMLQVQFRPHENSEDGEKTLVFKRRNIPQGSGKQVRRPNPQESDPSTWPTEGVKWQDVAFDTAKQAYVSKLIPATADMDQEKAAPTNSKDFISGPDKKKDDGHEKAVHGGRPIPNKISLWLTGVPIRALQNVKMFKGNTQMYTRLQERRTLEKGVEELRVVFQLEGGRTQELIYRRDFSHETLGTEWSAAGGRRPLIYSEKDKTLYSQVLETPLPQKVMSWLTRGVCLASLVSPRPQMETPGSKQEEVVTKREDAEIHWNHPKDGPMRCKAEVSSCGFVYYVRKFSKDTECALEWVEQMSSWYAEGETQPLPYQVTSWLKSHGQRMCTKSTLALDELEWHDDKVWPIVKQVLAPKWAQRASDIARASAALNHDFKSPLNFITACVHSADQDHQWHLPSNKRLAFLGAWVVEYLITELLLDEQNTILDNAENPEIVHDTTGEAQDAQREAKFVWLRDLCCNHISYAVRCVRLRLHEHILISEENYHKQQWVKAFEPVVPGPDAKLMLNGEDWVKFVSHDAPRALGDVFLAAVAAVVLDAGWKTAKGELDDIIQKHVDECSTCLSCCKAVDWKESYTYGEQVPVEVFNYAPDQTWASRVLGGDWTLQDAFERRFSDGVRCKITDLHLSVCTEVTPLEGYTEKRMFVVPATSPRASKIRCAFEAAGKWMKPAAICPMAATSMPQSTEGPTYYCKDCKMTLNGPTQWQDHKVGKRHRKNTKRNHTKDAQDPGHESCEVEDTISSLGTMSSIGGPASSSVPTLPSMGSYATGPYKNKAYHIEQVPMQPPMGYPVQYHQGWTMGPQYHWQ